MELVTGRAGTPHITSQQDRQRNQGTFGDGAYILKTGNQLDPVVQSSNKIQIKDGALMFQGALFSVKVGTVDEVTIANGSQGMQRKDLIVARYNYDAGENVESATWVVIQGTPAASNPVTPEYTEGDIQAGDTTVECPVFIVTLDGINITGVEMVPEIAPDVPEIMAQLEELNSNNIVESGHNDNGYWRKYGDGTLEMWDDTLISGVNINSQDGWNYYASGSKTIMMPVKSLTYVMPVVTARGECAPWVSVPGAGLGTDRFLAWIYASTSNDNVNVWLSWRCFGTWK